MGNSATNLRMRESQFVVEYLKDLNGKEAMIRIGYTGLRPDDAAWRLLQRPRVRVMLQKAASKVLAKVEATAERITMEAAAIAFSDPRELIDEHGALRPLHTLPDHAAAAVGDLEFENVTVAGREGEASTVVSRLKKLKRWNKVEALKFLGQVRGMTQPDRPAPVSVFNIQINL